MDRSAEFRGLWATHAVRLQTKREKCFNHPVVVGERELSYTVARKTPDCFIPTTVTFDLIPRDLGRRGRPPGTASRFG